MTKFNKTKEWLIELYVIKERSRKEVALECGLSESGLKSLLKKWNIKKEKLNIPREELENLVNQKLSHQEIEQILNISQTTLYRYLYKYSLKILSEPKIESKYDDIDDEMICQLYLDGFSSVEIGEEFNITHKTVLAHLKHCGITPRSRVECQWVQLKEFPKELKSYDYVYDLYINQRLSKKDLAKKFNCDPCVIDRVLKEFNIHIRNNSESKIGLITGDKHWNWKGGITSLARRLREYFGTNLTQKVLERDHYKCTKCGSKHLLHVHHIKPFSEILKRILEENSQLDPINDINQLYNIATRDKEFRSLDNLITYCKNCHYQTHGYNLLADNKSGELLENLELES